MKDKRAFTLIEVLGVLVIIGFIGAIAVPAVANIVNKSKQRTAEESAKAISRAARNYYEAQQLDYIEVKEVSLVDKTIEFEGKRPTKGTAYFDENGHMYVKMYYNGYCVVVDEQGETTSEKTSQQDCKVSGVVVSFETGDKNITLPSFEEEQGNAIGELPVLEREGYIFKGWYYKDINGNEQQASSNTIIEDSVIMTLYAKWEPLKYVVTLSGNGETLTEVTGWTISGSTATKTLSYGTMYGVLPSINKIGYKFLGWFTENGVKVESTSLVNITSNHTLTAKLEKEKYIVTLKTEIGQIPQTEGWILSSVTTTYDTATKTIAFEDAYGTLPELTKEGYRFQGWYDSNGNKVESTTVINVLSDHTLTAIWRENAYVVSFDAKGGTVSPETKEVSYNGTYGSLPTPVKTGYTFLGWYTLGGEQITSTSKVMTAGNHTLNAVYDTKEYTVTFNANGGNVSKDSISVAFNTTYGELPTPTRTGYSFQGWYTAKTGGTQVTSSTIYTLIDNQVLYARWSGNEYTVTFNTAGGTSVSNITVTMGSAYGTLPTTTKTGYNFLGWYTMDGALIENTTIVNKTSNHTLYAQWEVNKYVLTLDANGGTISYTTKEITYGAVYGELPIPSKTGYAFNGWYTVSGTKVESTTIVNTAENHKLVANWSVKEYTVTFNASGGSVSTTSKKVTYNNLYGELPTPSKTGHNFLGWYTMDGTLIESSTKVQKTSDHTLYAQWGENEYTLSFNANGGTVSPASAIIKYNSEYGTLPNPSRIGYRFLGWFTDANAGTQVSASTKYTAAGNITVYAHWELKEYTVTFDANGGNVSTTTGKVVDDLAYGTLPTPTRTGYTFNGWYTAKTGGTKVESTTIVDLTTNQTLYARWTAQSYTVTFVYNNGAANTIKSVNYTSAYGELPSPSKTGYTFNGWYNSSNTQVTKDTVLSSPENVTLTASWTANKYDVTFVYGNGTSNTTSKVTYDSTYGTLPSPSKTGYTFNGWYTAQTGGTKVLNTTTVATAKNHTLYAQYTVNSYYVTLRTTIGSISSSSWTVSSTTTTNDTAKKKIAYGSTYSELPTLSKAGYTFNGWYTDNTSGTVVTSTTTMNSTSDHTLYARWTANTYTVTFDTNKPSKNYYVNGETVYFNPVTAQVCDASEAISTTGTKTGCMKWYTFLDNASSSTVNLILDHDTQANGCYNERTQAIANNTYSWNSNIKSTARLITASEIAQITNVSTSNTTPYSGYLHSDSHNQYVGNAGTNSYAWLFDNTKECETYGCNHNDSNSKGYWTDTAAGSTYAWTISHTGFFGTSIYGARYCEPGPYGNGDGIGSHGIRPVITVNKNLLYDTVQTKNVTYDKVYGELPTPSKTGYTFLGWYTTGGVKATSSTIVNASSNHTLYAQWSQNTYEIIFTSIQSGEWTITNVNDANEIYTWNPSSASSYKIIKPRGTYTYTIYQSSNDCSGTRSFGVNNSTVEVNLYCGEHTGGSND